MTLFNPPLAMFPGLTSDMLPSIGVVPKIPLDFVEGNIHQQNLEANLPFDVLLHQIAEMTGKLEELRINKESENLQKRERTFGEITSTKDFHLRCTDHSKACAIGLLPAMTLADYELENFNSHLSIL